MEISPSLIVSLCALGTSIVSLYYSSFRRGKAVLVRPTGIVLKEGPRVEDRGGPLPFPLGDWEQVFRLSLAFVNTGVNPRAVEDLSLRIQRGDEVFRATFGQWKATLGPKDDEGNLVASGGDYAHPFIIPARSAFQRFAVFGSTSPAKALLTGTYRATIEATFADVPAWRRLFHSIRSKSGSGPLVEFEFTLDQDRVDTIQRGEWTRAFTTPIR